MNHLLVGSLLLDSRTWEYILALTCELLEICRNLVTSSKGVQFRSFVPLLTLLSPLRVHQLEPHVLLPFTDRDLLLALWALLRSLRLFDLRRRTFL